MDSRWEKLITRRWKEFKEEQNFKNLFNDIPMQEKEKILRKNGFLSNNMDEIVTSVTERIIKFMPDVSSVEVKKDARIGGLPNGKSKTYDQGTLDAFNIKKMNEQYLFERTGDIEYAALMLEINIENWDEILKKIKKEDLYEKEGFGKEKIPHITILYGFHNNVKSKDVFDKIKDELKTAFTVKIKNISCFNTKEYDVLKINIESKFLEKLNKIVKSFPYTNSFSDYHPHMTIAYLKRGCGRKYEDVIDLGTNNTFHSTEEKFKIVYSTVNGNKSYLNF
jgi:2'-5' RNA ligase